MKFRNYIYTKHYDIKSKFRSQSLTVRNIMASLLSLTVTTAET